MALKPPLVSAWLTISGIVLSLLFLFGCVSYHSQHPSYSRWSAKHADEVASYQAYLDDKGVGDIVPMPQLLKSARDWHKCHAEPFSVPPSSLWPNLVPTLMLVKKFKKEGALIAPIAASAYRDPTLNECAGGAKKSRHLQLNAIDFDIETTRDSLEKLCTAWRTWGPEFAIGLGFYTPSRIHLDTGGYRTWGSDFSHTTSLCLQDK